MRYHGSVSNGTISRIAMAALQSIVDKSSEEHENVGIFGVISISLKSPVVVRRMKEFDGRVSRNIAHYDVPCCTLPQYFVLVTECVINCHVAPRF